MAALVFSQETEDAMSKESMPAIWTSYYRCGHIADCGLAPVCISIVRPRFELGYELAGSAKPLMPRRNMLELSYEDYRREYIALLEQRGFDSIRDELLAISQKAGGKDLVLLCYESLKVPTEWCHRWMFAGWWKKKPESRSPSSPTASCGPARTACSSDPESRRRRMMACTKKQNTTVHYCLGDVAGSPAHLPRAEADRLLARDTEYVRRLGSGAATRCACRISAASASAASGCTERPAGPST
jgi:hypothetical protein